MTPASPAADVPTHYEIRVRGVLDPGWSDWLGGLTITSGGGGETVLAGPIRDQAALHGLLAKIRDLGLPLLAVNRIGGEATPDHR